MVAAPPNKRASLEGRLRPCFALFALLAFLAFLALFAVASPSCCFDRVLQTRGPRGPASSSCPLPTLALLGKQAMPISF